MAEDLQLFSSKKRKFYLELENEYSVDDLLPANFFSKSDNHCSAEISVTQDLEFEDFDETEFSTSSISSFSREILDQKSLTVVKAKSRGEIGADRMPSEAELEEFFVAAEKFEQEKFADKYNYDIVKDVPLEGKYQWIQLHP